jgi:hypothetical protein
VAAEHEKIEHKPIVSKRERAYKPLDFIASQRTGVKKKQAAIGVVPGTDGWSTHAQEEIWRQEQRQQRLRRRCPDDSEQLWEWEEDAPIGCGDDSGDAAEDGDVSGDVVDGNINAGGRRSETLALFLPTCSLAIDPEADHCSNRAGRPPLNYASRLLYGDAGNSSATSTSNRRKYAFGLEYVPPAATSATAAAAAAAVKGDRRGAQVKWV